MPQRNPRYASRHAQSAVHKSGQLEHDKLSTTVGRLLTNENNTAVCCWRQLTARNSDAASTVSSVGSLSFDDVASSLEQ